MLKRILIGLVISSVLTVAGLFFARPYIENILKQKILSAAAQVGVQLAMKEFSLEFFPPRVAVTEVETSIPSLGKGKLKSASLGIGLGHIWAGRVDVSVRASQGTVLVYLPDNDPAVAVPQQTNPSQKDMPSLTADVGVNVEIQDVLFDVYKNGSSWIKTYLGRVEIRKSSFARTQDPLSFLVAGVIETYGLELPYQVSSDSLRISNDEIKADSIGARIAGLESNWQARLKPDGSQIEATGEVAMEDLSRLPKAKLPPEISDLKGSVKGKIKFAVVPNQPPIAEVQFTTSGVLLQVQREQKGIISKGPVALDVQVDGGLNSGNLDIRKFSFQADLTQTDIAIDPYFKKPKGVDLTLQGHASGNRDQVRFENSRATFAGASVILNGAVLHPLSQPQLHFDAALAPVQLESIARYLSMFAASPLKGTASAKMSGDVPLENPKLASIQVHELLLKQIRGTIQYEKKELGVRVATPITLNAKVQTAIQNLKVSRLTAQADLASDVAKLTVNGNMANSQSFSGRIKGELPSFARLSEIYLPLKAYKLEGRAHFETQISGPLDFQIAPMDLPLQIAGSVSVDIPAFKMPDAPSASKTAVGGEKSATPPTVEPFLKQHKIFSGLNLALKVRIWQLEMQRLKLADVFMDGRMTAKGLTGSASIGKLFGGSIRAKSFAVNPFALKSFFVGDVELSKLQIEPALQWMKPEAAAMMSGLLDGKIHADSSDPRAASFLADLQSDGAVTMADLKLKTIPFESSITDVLKRIPGVGTKPMADLKNMPFAAQMDYKLKNRVAQIARFHATSSRNDELNMQGTIDLDFMAQLKGEMRLVDPPIGGDLLKANQDEKGRLVLPLQISGALMKPNMDVASSVIQQMTTKMLEYQKNQFLKKSGDEIKNKVQDEIKKKLKGIFGS